MAAKRGKRPRQKNTAGFKLSLTNPYDQYFLSSGQKNSETRNCGKVQGKKAKSGGANSTSQMGLDWPYIAQTRRYMSQDKHLNGTLKEGEIEEDQDPPGVDLQSKN